VISAGLGIRHVALPALDLPRAIAFYTDTLGFRPYQVTDRDWAMLHRGGTTLSFIVAREPMRTPFHFGMNLDSVADVDQAYAALRERGVPGLQPPKVHRDQSYGFYLLDSEGNPLELIYVPLAPPELRKAYARDHAAVLLAHGSTDPGWAAPLRALLERVRAHLGPGTRCELAFMESTQPDLGQALRALKGMRHVEIIPVFLSSEGHVRGDLPRLVADAARANPGMELRLQAALGEDPIVREAMAAAAVDRLGLALQG
jgi:sirohydrochlorin cobaltochelatase